MTRRSWALLLALGAASTFFWWRSAPSEKISSARSFNKSVSNEVESPMVTTSADTCTDIESRVFHIEGNWIVLGERWIWYGNEAVKLLDPDLPRRLYELYKTSEESEALSWQEFEKNFKAKDAVFLANLVNLEIATRLQERPFLGFKDGRWQFVNFKKEIVCKTQPLECQRIGKKPFVLSAEDKSAALNEFKSRFEQTQIADMCLDYRKGMDPILKLYDNKVARCTQEYAGVLPATWKTLDQFCKSVSQTLSEINP